MSARAQACGRAQRRRPLSYITAPFLSGSIPRRATCACQGRACRWTSSRKIAPSRRTIRTRRATWTTAVSACSEAMATSAAIGSRENPKMSSVLQREDEAPGVELTDHARVVTTSPKSWKTTPLLTFMTTRSTRPQCGRGHQRHAAGPRVGALRRISDCRCPRTCARWWGGLEPLRHTWHNSSRSSRARVASKWLVRKNLARRKDADKAPDRPRKEMLAAEAVLGDISGTPERLVGTSRSSCSRAAARVLKRRARRLCPRTLTDLPGFCTSAPPPRRSKTARGSSSASRYRRRTQARRSRNTATPSTRAGRGTCK